MFSALRRWVRTHGVYRTLIVMPDSCKVHLSWTKSQALTWMYLHSRKDKVAKQQFSKVTNIFGNTLAVRYYRWPQARSTSGVVGLGRHCLPPSVNADHSVCCDYKGASAPFLFALWNQLFFVACVRRAWVLIKTPAIAGALNSGFPCSKLYLFDRFCHTIFVG